jgi:hypothetical protein
MKQILQLTFILILSLYTSDSLHAQTAQIENIQFYFDHTVNEVIITYDLINFSQFETYDVELIFKDGNNLVIMPKTVSGDIRKGVTGGANKKISWKVFDDVEDLSETARPFVNITAVVSIPIDPSMALILNRIDKSAKSKFDFKFKREGVMLLGIGTGINAIAFKIKGDDFIDQQKTISNLDEYNIAGANAGRCYTWSKISGGVSIICVGFAIYQYIWSDKKSSKKQSFIVTPSPYNGVLFSWVHTF